MGSSSAPLGICRVGGIAVVFIHCLIGVALGQEKPQAALPPVPSPTAGAQAGSNDDLLQEIRLLRKEVEEARKLKDQVQQLQNELTTLKNAPPTSTVILPPPATSLPALPPAPAWVVPMEAQEAPADKDTLPLKASYKYQIGPGPFGGGGYVHIADPNEEFVVNLTNQVTIDGTFYDRANMPTNEQGFNVPFTRTFLYGNITKNWKYQIGTQGFLGTYNLLDAWMAYSFGDWLTIRAGKGLTPPLYEYYAFTPALEPVITNSPLFQFAAKRPIGIMFSGNVLKNRLQYWAGVTNGGASTYYALDRNAEFNGAVDFTPFKGSDSIFENLGGGIGFSAGKQAYLLSQGGNSIGFSNNGEATTNANFITSTGVPFFAYNPGVRANGMQSTVAPHIYWYGRFSVVAEMMNFSRQLADATTSGRSTQWGYYVNLSYYLTGERDFGGNGFQGYSTVEPLHPFIPSRGQYGPGAWQIASQFSEVNVGNGDFARGFADPTKWANRLDQFMIGLNWWPNRYTRLSFDYVWTDFNKPIPITGPNAISTYNIFWMRFAMFF